MAAPTAEDGERTDQSTDQNPRILLTYLEGLDEGPEEDADGLSLSQQLQKTSCSEEPQKAQVDEIILQQRGRRESAWANEESG